MPKRPPNDPLGPYVPPKTAADSGPVERITLERSFHVATLDYDRNEIEARTVEFVTSVLTPLGS